MPFFPSFPSKAPEMYRHVTTLNIQEPRISCLAVHNTLLYAAAVNEVTVFDLSSYVQVDTFNAGDSSSGSVKSIAFDIARVYTAHQDGKIRVWRVMSTPSKRHRLVSTLPTMQDRLRRSLLPKNYVRVRRHHKRLWIQHCDTVSGLVVAGDLMYSVSWDKSFKIWDTASRGRCLESVAAHDDAVNAVAVSGDGVVYTGSADGCICVWGRSSGDGTKKKKKHALLVTLNKHKSAVNAMALNGDGSVLFSGGGDRSIMVWARNGNEHVAFVEALWGHTGAVLCLMNVGDWLVSGSSDRTVRIWRRGKGSGYSCKMVLEGHERAVKSLVAVPSDLQDGAVSICSGSLDGEIKAWEVSDTNCQSKLSNKYQIHMR